MRLQRNREVNNEKDRRGKQVVERTEGKGREDGVRREAGKRKKEEVESVVVQSVV